MGSSGRVADALGGAWFPGGGTARCFGRLGKRMLGCRPWLPAVMGANPVGTHFVQRTFRPLNKKIGAGKNFFRPFHAERKNIFYGAGNPVGEGTARRVTTAPFSSTASTRLPDKI